MKPAPPLEEPACFFDRRSSSRLSICLLVGRIATRVNGTACRRSNPPTSYAVQCSIPQAMSPESEPIKASRTCIMVARLLPLRHREMRTTRNSCWVFNKADVHSSTEENTAGEC